MYSQTTFRLLTALVVLGLFSTACHKMNFNGNDLRNFEEVNLIANNGDYNAGLVDPTLQNAWGLAWSPTGIAWVNGEADGVSELYTGAGAIVRPPVKIPSPTDTIDGAPTGIVFNSTKGFILPDKSAASFIFVGVDGVVSAWNGAAGNNAYRIADNSATSAYTGLALAADNGRNLIYAADFRSGKIDVWDTAWSPVSLSFRDPNIPWGYAPFNIQSISSWLYVSYAKVGANGHEAVGSGEGFVDVFTTGGVFVQRFASRGALNAPWGVAWAPAGWLTTADVSTETTETNSSNNTAGSFNSRDSAGPVILIGNLGDGKINVFATDGQYLGALQSNKHTIVIDGLWAIGFAPATATSIDPKRLYFTAGPNNQKDGLFGYLIKE